MRELGDDMLEAAVARARVPLVVAFHAPWCRPCRSVERLLDELAARYAGRVELARLDVDAHPTAAARAGVLALPTVVVFAGGRVAATLVGVRRRHEYERALLEVLPRGELDRPPVQQ